MLRETDPAGAGWGLANPGKAVSRGQLRELRRAVGRTATSCFTCHCKQQYVVTL